MITSPIYAIVLDTEISQTKNGKNYLKVLLKTNLGIMKSVIWDAPPNVLTNNNYPQKNDFIKIESFKDEIAAKGSLVINLPIEKLSIDEHKKEYEEITSFGNTSVSTEEIDECLNIIFDKNLFDNPLVSNLIKNCYKKYAKKIKSCPAATTNHHAYSGGLVIHVSEVLQGCKAIYEIYNKRYNYINKDVLFCSAILHDIGKLETYFMNDDGVAEIHHTEITLGHIYIGMSLIERTFYELSTEEQEQIGKPFLNEVLHCVAAHHGKVEHGSVREIQSIEAQILSSSDTLSARFGMLDKTIREIPKTTESKHGDKIKLHHEVTFFNSLGIQRGRS